MNNDFISMQCPNCGGRLTIGSDITSLKCENCGTVHLVKRSAEGIMLESYARCPICHRNDKSEKVTSIIRSQVQNSETVLYQTRTVYKNVGEKTVPVEEKYSVPIKTTQMSTLAKQLMAPGKPIIHDSISNFGSGCSLLFFLTSALIGFGSLCLGSASISDVINSSTASSKVTLILGSIMGIFFGLFVASMFALIGFIIYKYYLPKEKMNNDKKNANNKQIMQNWEKAMERYNKLYYCQRDDCVYILGENRSIPVGYMKEILFR